jgi:hypothetical protein
MAADGGYPEELAAWVDALQEREWRLSRARVRWGDGDGVSAMLVPDYVVTALASGIIGNLGYDLLKFTLKAWRRPRVRLPTRPGTCGTRC